MKCQPAKGKERAGVLGRFASPIGYLDAGEEFAKSVRVPAREVHGRSCCTPLRSIVLRLQRDRMLGDVLVEPRLDGLDVVKCLGPFKTIRTTRFFVRGHTPLVRGVVIQDELLDVLAIGTVVVIPKDR